MTAERVPFFCFSDIDEAIFGIPRETNGLDCASNTTRTTRTSIVPMALFNGPVVSS